MLSEQEVEALFWMRDCITLATEWTRDIDVETFSEDRKTFFATTRALEIISEASRRLTAQTTARHPAYDWRRMRDAGNFYRHVYDSVLERYVYETAREALPALLMIVETELRSAGEMR